MLPSCGWSQLSWIVGTGPRFSRSMCVGVEQRAPQLGLVGDRRADERRAHRLEHLRLGTLDDGDEREHVLLRRDRRLRRFAVDDGRQQVVGAAVLDDARRVAILRRDVGDAGRLQIGVDRLRDRVGHAGHGERRQARVRDRPAAAAESRRAACASASAISRL